MSIIDSDEDEQDTQSDDENDFIFGFGSILKTATHATWLTSNDNQAPKDGKEGSAKSSASPSLPGHCCVLRSSFGYRRGWNFRSATGFTALGITRRSQDPSDHGEERVDDDNDGINGVLFRVSRSMLAGFDRREVGYDRVQVPNEYMVLTKYKNQRKDLDPASQASFRDIGSPSSAARLWVYIPRPSYVAQADADHPILQSYVDTVLEGCLEWGGVDMCRAFIQTTYDWSPFFLNDTPSSRRPWLFRQAYDTIDGLLAEYDSHTHFGDRKHPEEFTSLSSAQSSSTDSGDSTVSMRGCWGLPRRNPLFIGRDSELLEIRKRLCNNSDAGRTTTRGVLSKLEIVGLGGVGKSQLVTEYCYRYFPSDYGLVIFIHAQSAESIVASYRQLMVDTSPGSAAVATKIVHSGNPPGSRAATNMDSVVSSEDYYKDTEQVVAEIKARLFRCKIPWLLVLDNLEDSMVLSKVLPHGGCGHVLVTTRRQLIGQQAGQGQLLGDPTGPLNHAHDSNPEEQTLLLECFGPSESVAMLRRALAGTSLLLDDQQIQAAHNLSELLGHLPLALGMAAAYMRRCDVDCSEYLARFTERASPSTQRRHSLGHEKGVSSSLSLSLNAIQKESMTAWEALRLLAWLGPDQITKKLLRTLLLTKHAQDAEFEMDPRATGSLGRWLPHAVASLGCSILLWVIVSKTESRRLTLFGFAAAVASASTFYVLRDYENPPSPPPLRHSSSFGTSMDALATSSNTLNSRKSFLGDVFEETDRIWTILKSYSLLVVKEGQGTMHRLLAQSLRSSQDSIDAGKNIQVGLRALLSSWSFKPEDVDTWSGSTKILEHVKTIVKHAAENGMSTIETAVLSREAGVFSAMALNRFEEAQSSLELSLKILDDAKDRKHEVMRARAAALHELGRVFRYQGQLQKSEDKLQDALEIQNRIRRKDIEARFGVAATLHELGVLEAKKHCLDSAATFLTQALELRRSLELESPTRDDTLEAACASTLHQLAAVHVAKKPPGLDIAELLLNEALSLNMQIGQRAATLKQLARVAIRRGDFEAADRRLSQALELYVELYGENPLHINVAAVKFQQGALCFQRELYDQAWLHFSECLRARRHVYAYSNGNHLEVSSVLHELGSVAMAQKRFEKANEMFSSEREILDQLSEITSDHQERLLQARLNNLTWLRKCAKARGDDDEARQLGVERTSLKRKSKKKKAIVEQACGSPLHQEALRCRAIARQYALATSLDQRKSVEELLKLALIGLSREMDRTTVGNNDTVLQAVRRFHSTVSESLLISDSSFSKASSALFKACDQLRDVLREKGVQVNDLVRPKK